MRRMLVGAAAALLALTGCGDLLEPAAAVVYGKKITIDRVEAQLEKHMQSRAFEQLAAQGDEGALKREFEQGYLSTIIMRAVLERAAEEQGIEITDEDVDTRIQEAIDQEYGGNAEQFEEERTEQGLTQAEVEDIAYDRLLQEALRAEVAAGAAPDEEDLRTYYEENEADFQLTRSQHVLVEDKDLAEQLAARLQGAPADRVDELFADLAAEHSLDPSGKERGGDLGFQAPGYFVEPFERALASLEEGEISDPVRTDFGWHVIRVTGTRTAPFEEVRAQLESELTGRAQEDAWREFLAAQFEEADVEVNPRYGEFDQELLRVIDPDASDVPGAEEGGPSPEPSVPAIPVPAPPPPG